MEGTGISPTKRAMWAAIASAIVHELATIIMMIYIGVHGEKHPRPEDWGGFWSVDYMKAVWVWRDQASSMEIAMSFFFAASLFLFLYTVTILRDLYKEEKGNLRHIMANCFIIGGLLRLFEFLQLVGIELGCRFISKIPGLPDAAWISLTIAHGVVRGIGSYVFEGDTITIIVGVGILTYLSFRGSSSENHRLSKRHGILGGIIVFFLLLVFFLNIAVISTEVSNRGDWLAMGIFGGLLGLILWPAWLIWLGVQIKDLEIPQESDMQTSKLLGQQL